MNLRRRRSYGLRWTSTSLLVHAFFTGGEVSAQTQSIYGIHDFEPRPDGFLARLEAAGVRGSITATEAVGHNPSDHSGKDYRSVSSRGQDPTPDPLGDCP